MPIEDRDGTFIEKFIVSSLTISVAGVFFSAVNH